LKRALLYPFVCACETLATALPRRAALSVFAAIADLAGRLDPRAEPRVLQNLEIAWGPSLSEAERRRIFRESFRDFGRNLVDFLRLPRLRSTEILQLVEFEGLQHLDEALAKGRGVLAVSAHFGNWEFLGAALSARGYRIHVLAREARDSRVDERLQSVRERAGLVVHVGHGGLLGIMRALRQGEIVGVLLDQDTEGAFAFADFFGRPARTPTTPFKIARRLGAEIVPMLIHLDGDLRHRVRIHPALECSQDGDAQMSLDLEAWHRILEEAICARPTQWVWFHRRWKTRPRLALVERTAEVAATTSPQSLLTPSSEMLITR
jgi:KDO2-lipid IV(A) lauroyltransferase